MTDSAYPELKKFEDGFKGTVWAGLELGAEAAVFATLPWLRFWPLSLIAKRIISEAMDETFEKFVLAIDITAIKWVNKQAGSVATNALISLLLIERELGANSDEYKKAREEAKLKFSAALRYGATL